MPDMSRPHPIMSPSSSAWQVATRRALLLGISFCCVSPLQAADLAQTRALYEAGKYRECINSAAEGVKGSPFNETWRHLKANSEMAVGEFAAALATIEATVTKFPSSIKAKWLAQKVLLHNNQPKRARALLDEIEQTVRRASFQYSDSTNRVLLGRYFLLKGADPRQVLDVFYDPVKKSRPNYAEVYIASGELALEKHDYKLAADEFRQALKLKPDSVEVHFGLARAFAGSDSEKAQSALEGALKLNPNHVDSLLLLVDGHVDS